MNEPTAVIPGLGMRVLVRMRTYRVMGGYIGLWVVIYKWLWVVICGYVIVISWGQEFMEVNELNLRASSRGHFDILRPSFSV